MELYKQKFRIKSSRLPKWDYGSMGAYFITICIKYKKCHVGTIMDGKLELNHVGKIAKKYWLQIPCHFSCVSLDQFIIMPNHMHGIIVINKQRRDEALPRLYNGDYRKMSQISPNPRSIPVIIGSYKSIVTKTINRENPNISFAWQSRFHDRIIRNHTEWNYVQQYIKNNPFKWKRDEYNQYRDT